MKFLIIRFSSIGDIVLASPVLRCVKKQVPNATVHFLTKKTFKIVTQHNPYIDKFYYLEDNLNELIDLFKKEEYDYVIDLHNNFRSNKIKRALKKETFTINKLSVQKFLLTKLKIDVMPNLHITQRSIDTVAPLGIRDDGYGLDYFIPTIDEVSQDHLPTSHVLGFIVVVIGASYYTKKLPVYKLKELCSKIDHPIILIGGPEDAFDGYDIASIDPIKIYNSCGKFNLNESADLVRQAKFVISHDTGMLYIACAFNKPTMVIWGGTSPSLDVEPYYGSRFLQHQIKALSTSICLNLSCQPCSNYGTTTCPRGHFNCMNKIDVNEVVKLVKLHLSA